MTLPVKMIFSSESSAKQEDENKERLARPAHAARRTSTMRVFVIFSHLRQVGVLLQFLFDALFGGGEARLEHKHKSKGDEQNCLCTFTALLQTTHGDKHR